MNGKETIFELLTPGNNLIVGSLLMVLSSWLNIYYLQDYFGHLVDTIQSPQMSMSSHGSDAIMGAIYYILKVYTALALASFVRYYLLELAADSIRKKIHIRVFSCMLDKPMTFFDQHGTAELVNLLSDDARVLADAATKQLATGVGASVTICLGVYHMVSASSTLSNVAFWVVTPLAAVAFILVMRLRKLRADVQSRVANSMQIAQECIANVSTVRAFSKESQEVSNFSASCNSVLVIKEKATTVHSTFHGAVELSNGIMVAAIIFRGGSLLQEGTLSAGALTTFLLYARTVAAAIKEVSQFCTNMAAGKAAYGRIQEIIEGSETVEGELVTRLDEDGGNRILENIEGSIRFHSVSFSYPSRPRTNVLSDINLDIVAGSKFAIYGASGSGKTTLARLMLRLYDVKEGNGMIKLDGVNIRNLEPEWLRRQIGYVSQDPMLFSGTIRENIMYGIGIGNVRRTTDDDDTLPGDLNALLYRTARDANALEFILRLPEKFQTIIGERGTMLSGGQKQRIAIARALIKNPRILLFDEATSALDPENERLVQEAIDRIGQNRTVIIIAHRLSTVRNAAKIALIVDGKLSEVGTFEDLMAIPFGRFRRLTEGQI